MHTANQRPLLLLTMGDVAGIGPELIARSWPELLSLCRPVVVGDAGWMRKGLGLVGAKGTVRNVRRPGECDADPDVVPCLPATEQNLGGIEPGKVSAAAGRAAYDFLCAAIEQVQAGAADGIVTAP